MLTASTPCAIKSSRPGTNKPRIPAPHCSLTVGAGKNYTLLYLTAAALTFLGAVAIIPVKKVK